MYFKDFNKAKQNVFAISSFIWNPKQEEFKKKMFSFIIGPKKNLSPHPVALFQFGFYMCRCHKIERKTKTNFENTYFYINSFF